MKTVQVTGPGEYNWVDVDAPTAGPNDILVAPKACGICGSDGLYIKLGGIPPRQGKTRLGHEVAAEVREVGENVTDVEVGDHVVIDNMTFTDGIFGNGGEQGGLAELAVIKDAEAGKQFRVIPKDIPWRVAALNEPMAVALHGVNRTEPKEGDKVVVFGAGPVGLGALLGFKRAGCHVVVVDVQDARLETAKDIGADAVINSATEDLAARLVEIHGDAATAFVRGQRPGTDIYFDAAGHPSVPQSVAAMAKQGATLGIVAVYKAPVELDFPNLLRTELTIRWAVGYPTEIFEVTDDIIENADKYDKIISHTFPFDQSLDAIKLALTPGATDKVVIVFDDDEAKVLR